MSNVVGPTTQNTCIHCKLIKLWPLLLVGQITLTSSLALPLAL